MESTSDLIIRPAGHDKSQLGVAGLGKIKTTKPLDELVDVLAFIESIQHAYNFSRIKISGDIEKEGPKILERLKEFIAIIA